MLAGLFGLLIGLVLGLTGAGGSVLAVPLLKQGLGIPTAEAMGLSLGAVALAAGYGALIRLRQRSIVWLPAIVLTTAGALGSPLGTWLRHHTPEPLLNLGFALLVLAVALQMWRQSRLDPESTRVVRAEATGGEAIPAACNLSPSGQFELQPRCVGRMSGVGLTLGVVSGLFGVGGGFIIVPALTLFAGLDARRAVATSLVAISLVSAVGFSLFVLQQSNFAWPAFIPVAIGGLAGMLLGSLIGRYIAGPRLQQLFVVLMLAMAGWMLVN